MSHYTGPGQYPGQPNPQWGGGWMPPSAPQPGVIPLQPLSVGDILGGAFSTFRRYAKPLIGVMLAVQGIGILVVAAAIGVTLAVVQDLISAVFDLAPGQSPHSDDVLALLLAFIPAGVLMLVAVALGAAMISALGASVVQEAVVGRPTTFGAMWRRSRSRLPAVLGVLLLTWLIAGGPMLLLYAICIPLIILSASAEAGPSIVMSVMLLGLFVCIPVTVWLMTRFSLASAVAVCEDLGPVAALRRSSRLVSGDWWRVFGITMLGYLVAGVVGYLIQMPFSFVGMFALFPALAEMDGDTTDPSGLIAGLVVYAIVSLIGGVIGSLFQYGYPQLLVTLVYVDQRIRKENLAAALLATAVPGPASAPAPAPTPTPAPDQM
ncbi:hypothetical protein OG756_33455 [Streptomyces sp. NBC_01310]|uniref:hypothetical protein n=1 Tax=Streptomyces sp. NBC_01310 TaxID=2903820 RepID=UPI0035B5E89D|nr:hypothetical protein OG756_33455 [Streptomyces sp. NBC_01310]